ncbi:MULTISPECIES: hypothetical protein [Mycobacterium]|nr:MULTISPECIES: hypothetical protein [Mycobacterium]QNI09724.1 hypothetical protein GAN17_25330 [Mycobacterium kubicae]QNI15265.1 hypothetical protein GAN18_29230 [Mycobacterium kubicae]
MSSRITSTGGAGAAVAGQGWIVVDPAGLPYAWYGPALAVDADAAMAVFEPQQPLRQQLCERGWSVRAGAATDLFGHAVASRASA